ncbi:TerB family tellurite resistance protein [Pseudomonas typographi]|uniref:DnaJ domain-containing protein n=1 Tax=Pseudomonas typographi TaxID=2715964 RepID=A0ABR7YV87_9PSED|nr:TerB family tellurite resistance protein [Pseudomonas typographi]MBD1552101.1 DnaJ domain-containing protein [Pseudomonas typographi]MBD1585073.1 DnaJ domain-containing protein [Pseudomonas typographi]MBD1597120.1 DnaJ domain-containing protein [Pseudomonas typographi]
MLWPVTLLGLLLGFAVANIPGAILGALLGQVVDRRLELYSWPQLRERLGGKPAMEQDELLFTFLGRLAKVNGRVDQSHIEQARLEMQRLGLNAAATARAIEAFNRGRDGKRSLRPYLRALQRKPTAAEGLLRAGWRMVWADYRAHPVECEWLVDCGHCMGWSTAQVHALSADYEPQQRQPLARRDEPYQAALRLLGVPAAAEPDQVKRAYRRLLSKHHPDKLEGAGASDGRVREATEYTRRLHDAYALIREREGF